MYFYMTSIGNDQKAAKTVYNNNNNNNNNSDKYNNYNNILATEKL